MGLPSMNIKKEQEAKVKLIFDSIIGLISTEDPTLSDSLRKLLTGPLKSVRLPISNGFTFLNYSIYDLGDDTGDESYLTMMLKLQARYIQLVRMSEESSAKESSSGLKRVTIPPSYAYDMEGNNNLKIRNASTGYFGRYHR
jgi:hypothetical protein